jgi:hypothetical protein
MVTRDQSHQMCAGLDPLRENPIRHRPGRTDPTRQDRGRGMSHSSRDDQAEKRIDRMLTFTGTSWRRTRTSAKAFDKAKAGEIRAVLGQILVEVYR